MTAMNERPTSEFSRAISRELRGYMSQQGITQERVAALIGKRRSYVSEHTNGTRSPTTDLLDAVAELAGVDTRQMVGELLRRMSSPPAVRESEEETARRLAREALAGTQLRPRGRSQPASHQGDKARNQSNSA